MEVEKKRTTRLREKRIRRKPPAVNSILVGCRMTVFLVFKMGWMVVSECDDDPNGWSRPLEKHGCVTYLLHLVMIGIHKFPALA